MSWREYADNIAKNSGTKSAAAYLDDMRRDGEAGQFWANTLEIIFEMASDPIFMAGLAKGLINNLALAPNTATYW